MRTYAAETEEALAGLRVAADRASLVREPDQFAAFARYEHQVDLYMSTRDRDHSTTELRRERSSA